MFLLSFSFIFANIIRCLGCFTLLMNLHDFVADPVNPVHSFHDAHSVPFCLTSHLCPHQASAVLVCLWTCVVWKVFGTCDDGIWSHSWSPTRLVERLSHSWSPTSVLVRGHSSGLVEWSRTRGVPRVYSGGHSSVVNGLALVESRSSEVSVLISRRLRRMVSEVFGKHFGGLYSWSTMSSSFVSPSVASLSHCESFHCSCICMAQDPCLVTFVLLAPRFINMSSMSA